MQTLSFDVAGMTCGGCTGRVQRALSQLSGVSHAEVTLSPGVATVVVDATLVTPAQIESAITGLGYPASVRAASDQAMPAVSPTATGGNASAKSGGCGGCARSGSCRVAQHLPAMSARLPASSKVLIACGCWLVGLGVYFTLLRPALLPEDLRYVGASIETLRVAAPGLERWLGHVFNVMGGFMLATGVMTVLLAGQLLAQRHRWTLVAMSVAGVASVALMSATNFMLQSDFRWLLLLPALLWMIGLTCYLREHASPVDALAKRMTLDGS